MNGIFKGEGKLNDAIAEQVKKMRLFSRGQTRQLSKLGDKFTSGLVTKNYFAKNTGDNFSEAMKSANVLF